MGIVKLKKIKKLNARKLAEHFGTKAFFRLGGWALNSIKAEIAMHIILSRIDLKG